MNRDWLAPAVAFGLAAWLAYLVGTELRRRREKRFLKEEVVKWEDEGGRIPGATLSAETTTESP